MERIQEIGWNFAGWIEAHYPEPATFEARLEQIELLARWRDSFRPFPLSVVEELRQNNTINLTYNSNAIEGNTLTYHETEAVLLSNIVVPGHSMTEHQEVVSHLSALRYVETLAEEGTLPGQYQIREIQSLILGPINSITGHEDSGQYRRVDVAAGGTRHRYPPNFQIQQLMDEFESWIRSQEASQFRPVELAAEVHYRFVAIHPFRDGNGRTARLLMNLVLLRAGYPLAIIPVTKRWEYMEALAAADLGNPAPFKAIVASAVRDALILSLLILSTAADSRGLGTEFYRALLESQS